MKLNTLQTWPHVHVCLIDRTCWHEMWTYGSPMRIYWDAHDDDRQIVNRFVDIPGLKRLSEWRSKRAWNDELYVAEEVSPEEDRSP